MEKEKKSELPVKIEPIVQQMLEAVPKLERGKERAVKLMSAITEIKDDEQLEEVIDLLGQIAITYTAMNGLRAPITEQLRDIASFLISFEAELDPSKNNHASRLRNLVGQYNQQKIDAKNKAAEDARKLKEKENYKVDLTTQIKKNLSDLLITRVQEVNSGAKGYFEQTTLETYDTMAATFRSFNPKLKQEIYLKCFEVKYDSRLTKDEFDELFKKITTEEPYEKWNEAVTQVLAPVLNEWKGRLPELKDKLTALKNAASEEEKKKLEAANKLKEEAEQRKRDEELAGLKRKQEEEIQQKAEVDKMGNEFQEQAIVQESEDTGPTSLILKFKDPKPVKPLCEIIYKCFMHPKFPGIQKKNQKKELLMDKHGFPELVSGVDFWVNFFLKNCDTNVDGIEIKEIPKVIIRK
jgi:hypothetical protein